MTSVADKMYQASLGLQDPDSVPDTVVEDNPTFERFNEMVEQMLSLMPSDTPSVYLKFGKRMMADLSKDLRRVPEESLKNYCGMLAKALHYVATGEELVQE